MNIVQAKKKTNRIMGIDNSTLSTAYAIIDDGYLVSYGEIDYAGSNYLCRLNQVKKNIEKFVRDNDFSKTFMENTINVKSNQTAIKMAYSAGVVMSCIMEKSEIFLISPLVWQCFIGNNPLTISEKKYIKNMYPGKSKSWYSNENRRVRKKKTMDWANDKFNIECSSDNISDAIGLAWYGYANNN